MQIKGSPSICGLVLNIDYLPEIRRYLISVSTTDSVWHLI